MIRRWTIGAALVALLGAALPASAAEKPYLDERFENGVDVFRSGHWGMRETSDGHQGSGLESLMRTGDHWGSSGWWYFQDHGFAQPEELYWRYWVRFDPDFYIAPPARGKLPGPATLGYDRCNGGKPSVPGQPCFSARMLFSRTYPSASEPGYPNGPNGVTRLGFYVYHLDSPSHRGDIWTWDMDSGVLDNGKWYCVEGRIKLNTPGAHNGVLQGWVDGKAAFDKTDIAFRRSTEGSMDIKSFWFDIYYGGSDTSPRNNWIHFDSLALGSEKIGCSEAHNGTFWDDDYSIFEDDIEWMAAKGITKGCNPPTNDMYCPNDPVTRDVMAVYIARALDLPAASTDYFDDDDGSPFEADINRMAAAGITRGCGERMFCPGSIVDRGQMAAFLRRALGLSDDGGGDLFLDDDTSIFQADIDRLATAGVTKGCNPPTNDRFCPMNPVDRGAMAAFLHRAVGDS